MNRKGQGALEYLLIIGGAVLIAAIVITLLMSVRGPSEDSANQALLDSQCAHLTNILGPSGCDGGNPAAGTTTCNFCCHWDSDLSRCIGDKKSERIQGCFGGGTTDVCQAPTT